jgi:hypothetical protein
LHRKSATRISTSLAIHIPARAISTSDGSRTCFQAPQLDYL